ncbi:MAG: hypothetical protein MK193_12135 [Lentisphaeria bacterium]|nr:hypothetical protein [Lentisphaeria bacterium]
MRILFFIVAIALISQTFAEGTVSDKDKEKFNKLVEQRRQITRVIQGESKQFEQLIDQALGVLKSSIDSPGGGSNIERAKKDFIRKMTKAANSIKGIRARLVKQLNTTKKGTFTAQAIEMNIQRIDAHLNNRLDQIIKLSQTFLKYDDHENYYGHTSSRVQSDKLDRMQSDMVRDLESLTKKIARQNDDLLRRVKAIRDEDLSAALSLQMEENQKLIQQLNDEIAQLGMSHRNPNFELSSEGKSLKRKIIMSIGRDVSKLFDDNKKLLGKIVSSKPGAARDEMVQQMHTNREQLSKRFSQLQQTTERGAGAVPRTSKKDAKNKRDIYEKLSKEAERVYAQLIKNYEDYLNVSITITKVMDRFPELKAPLTEQTDQPTDASQAQ